MRSIGNYIVVSPIDEEVKTGSGITLTGNDMDQFRYKKAKVVKPGTDVTTINEGDVLYYDKSHSFTMMIEDTQYTIIQLRDVVVVL
jgi:co-chaperonin GroES (HSP10)